MKNLSFSTLCFLLLFTSANAQNKSAVKGRQTNPFASQIEVIMEAFKNKKSDKLNQLLVSDYTINGIPKGLEPLALPQIFEQMPTFTKYYITEIKKEKENQRVQVSFILKEEKIDVNLLFNKQGKIKELNLLEGSEIN